MITENKTMADKLMYIPEDDTQNYSFFWFELPSGWNIWTINLIS